MAANRYLFNHLVSHYEDNFQCALLFEETKNYQTGSVPVYMRITVNGKRSELTSGRECEPSQWMPSAGRMRGTKEHVKTFNNYLDTLRAQVDDAHGAMIKAQESITAESLKNRFMGKEESPKMLIEVFEEHTSGSRSW